MVKKMEEEERSQQKKHFAMAVIWTHEIYLQSWALYLQDHITLPHIQFLKCPQNWMNIQLLRGSGVEMYITHFLPEPAASGLRVAESFEGTT